MHIKYNINQYYKQFKKWCTSTTQEEYCLYGLPMKKESVM